MMKRRVVSLRLLVLGLLIGSSTVLGPLVAYANGAQWSPVASTETSSLDNPILRHVACPTPTSCQAMGNYYDGNGDEQLLIQTYNGGAWTVAAGADPVGSANVTVDDLVCVSAAFCQAVGSYSDGLNGTRSLIYTYNGSSWSATTHAVPGGATFSRLESVDCTSATFCQAVGIYIDGSSVGHTLIQRYNGTSWSLVSSPDPVNSKSSGLRGIDCISTSFCQAVGYSRDNDDYQHTQIQTYNGTSWSIVASADVINDAAAGALSDITCTSAIFCQAVGFYREPDFTFRSITKMYNGTAWSVATIANQAGYDVGTLGDVSCVSSTFCRSVGSYSDGSVQHPLLHTYDGTTWSVATLPTPSDYASGYIDKISCPSEASCHTTGLYTTDGGAVRALMHTYNGTSWSVVEGLDPNTDQYGYFAGIDCASATFCQAVGSYRDSSNEGHVLKATFAVPVVATPPADSGQGVYSPLAPMVPAKTYVSPQRSAASSGTASTDRQPTDFVAAIEERADTFRASDDAATSDASQDKSMATTANARSNTWWWAIIIGAAILVIAALGLRAYRRIDT